MEMVSTDFTTLTVFHSVYKNGCLTVSDLSHMLSQSIKSYTFHYHVLRVKMFEKYDPWNR